MTVSPVSRLRAPKHRSIGYRCGYFGVRSDFLTQGPAVERFEAALAERVGARHAVAVSSGTAGLHLACLAAGIRPGDRGLTAAVTFAASANCLLYAGGEAGFVDIDADTLGMTSGALEKALASAPDVKGNSPRGTSGLAASGSTRLRKDELLSKMPRTQSVAAMPAASLSVVALMRT